MLVHRLDIGKLATEVAGTGQRGALAASDFLTTLGKARAEWIMDASYSLVMAADETGLISRREEEYEADGRGFYGAGPESRYFRAQKLR